MTMKARVKATGEVIEVAKIEEAMWTDLTTSGADEKIYYTDDLDFNLDPPQPEATISGWVARDQRMSFADKGNLTLFAEKPTRDYYDCNDLTYGFWSDNEKPTIPLSADLFPDLTWQDDPIEVEITIKPKKR
jgi:hypothetical protein